jgi:hypothetical protein
MRDIKITTKVINKTENKLFKSIVSSTNPESKLISREKFRRNSIYKSPYFALVKNNLSTLSLSLFAFSFIFFVFTFIGVTSLTISESKFVYKTEKILNANNKFVNLGLDDNLADNKSSEKNMNTVKGNFALNQMSNQNIKHVTVLKSKMEDSLSSR